MTHEERERDQQWVRDMARTMSTDTLRTARARLLDIVEAARDNAHEVLVLRGQVVHAEIIRREEGEAAAAAAGRAIKQLWTGDGEAWIESLCRTDGAREKLKSVGLAAQTVKGLVWGVGAIAVVLVVVAIVINIFGK
jgi:hypothetical protein